MHYGAAGDRSTIKNYIHDAICATSKIQMLLLHMKSEHKQKERIDPLN
jgi:hypothetical protein